MKNHTATPVIIMKIITIRIIIDPFMLYFCGVVELVVFVVLDGTIPVVFDTDMFIEPLGGEVAFVEFVLFFDVPFIIVCGIVVLCVVFTVKLLFGIVLPGCGGALVVVGTVVVVVEDVDEGGSEDKWYISE